MASDTSALTIDKIRSRHHELSGSIIRTPTVRLLSRPLERLFDGGQIHLKLECLQHTGTFKARGALSVAYTTPRSAPHRGFTGASAGNHAIAVAWAAKQMGVSAKVVMQSSANPLRVERARAEGAEVVIREGGEATFAEAERLTREEGRTFIHPFEGPATSLGTGGVGLELVQDVSDLEAVVVAVGGGGLISGIAAAVKQINPRCMIYGVEPDGADAVSRGLAAGEPVTLDKVNTIADSLAPPMSLPFSLSLISRYVDDVVTVSDEQLCAALVILQEQACLAVEAAAAAALAGALGPLRHRLSGKRMGMIICGSNIDATSYAALHERGRPSAQKILA